MGMFLTLIIKRTLQLLFQQIWCSKVFTLVPCKISTNMNQFCQNPIARKFVHSLILSTILIPVCFIVTLFIPCEFATSWKVLMVLTSVVIIVVKMPQKRLPIKDKAVLITGEISFLDNYENIKTNWILTIPQNIFTTHG